MTERLNILVITSDQQRWDAVGWENPVVQTPHLNGLAARGTIYDRAYTCNPVCTPARCSLLTGHLPSRHGCYTIGTSLPMDYPTVPGFLSRAGYFTGLIGKGHFSSCCTEGMFEAPPNIFNTQFFRQWDGPFYGFERVRLNIDHGPRDNAASMHYRIWLEEQGVRPADYFSDERYPYASFGIWDLPAELSQSAWVAEETIAAIDSATAREKPFFLWSSFADPHNPCYVSEPWASLHDRSEVPVYRLRKGEMADRPPFYQSLIEGNDHRGEPILDGEKAWFCVSPCPEIATDTERREIMALYFGMISQMDAAIGRILAALEVRGQLEQTLIVFTSDHGDYMGNHGLWWKGLPAYEDAQRVPMLVAHPRQEEKGIRCDALQSLVDIPTTFLSVAGLPPQPLQQGVDQTPVWTGESKSLRDHVLVEFRPTESPYKQTTLITQREKLVCYTPVEYGELYALEIDPEQSTNLWDDPAWKERRERLMHRLVQAQMQRDGCLRQRTMWA